MISKQDRQGARTVPELDRRYNIGKSFDEALRVAEDAQKSADEAKAAADLANKLAQDANKFSEDVRETADSAQTAADEAKAASELANKLAQDTKKEAETAKTAAESAQSTAESAQEMADLANQAVQGLDQDAIFNLLTNNGQAQGIYKDENGDVYINASYIVTGTLLADLINTGVIKSEDGTMELDLSRSTLSIKSTEAKSDGKVVIASQGITLYGFDHRNRDYLNFLRVWPGAIERDGTVTPTTIIAPYSLQIQGNTGMIVGNPEADMTINGKTIILNGKTVSWKANGDGTYTLVGQ